jgi:hypothetical protein
MIENQLISPHPEVLLRSKSLEGCAAGSILSSHLLWLALGLVAQDEGDSGRHG